MLEACYLIHQTLCLPPSNGGADVSLDEMGSCAILLWLAGARSAVVMEVLGCWRACGPRGSGSMAWLSASKVLGAGTERWTGLQAERRGRERGCRLRHAEAHGNHRITGPPIWPKLCPVISRGGGGGTPGRFSPGGFSLRPSRVKFADNLGGSFAGKRQ